MTSPGAQQPQPQQQQQAAAARLNFHHRRQFGGNAMSLASSSAMDVAAAAAAFSIYSSDKAGGRDVARWFADDQCANLPAAAAAHRQAPDCGGYPAFFQPAQQPRRHDGGAVAGQHHWSSGGVVNAPAAASWSLQLGGSPTWSTPEGACGRPGYRGLQVNEWFIL